jgi:hypothetical protein
VLWVPGYGNALLSSNRNGRPAWGWHATGDQLATAQKALRLQWDKDRPEASTRVTLLGEAQPPVALLFGDDALVFEVAATAGRPFYLPLVFRQEDRWIPDNGASIFPAEKTIGSGRTTTQSLRLIRTGTGVTHDLEIRFFHPVNISFAMSPSSLGYGLFVRGIALRPADPAVTGPMSITFSRTAH